MGKYRDIPKCKRCGRILKTIKSRELGMGEICFKRWLEEQNRAKLFTMKIK